MIPIIEQSGAWRVAVSDVEPLAAFEPIRWLRKTAIANVAGSGASDVTAMVEMARVGGGQLPRALAGGEFRAGSGSAVVLEVGATGDLTLGAPRACPSSLLSKPLVAGLPDEFAHSVLAGMVAVVDSSILPPGVLRLSFAGYDEVDSSPDAFERVGRCLAFVIGAMCSSRGLTVDDVVKIIECQ